MQAFRKIILAALILCLLSSLLIGCDKKTPDDTYTTETVYLQSSYHHYEIQNGQSELVEVRFFNYDEFGRTTSFDGPAGKVTYTYDEAGNMTVTRNEALKDGEVIAVTETRRTYDQAGNEATREHYRIDGDTETLTDSWILTYDAQNRILEEKGADVIFRYVYTDNDGYTLTETDAKSGEILCITTAVKDTKGNVTSRITERKETGDKEEYTASYDEAGNILSETYVLNGAEADAFFYEYETHGEELRKSRVITKRDGVEIERTVYIYDENGNRTTVEVQTPDGTLKSYHLYAYTATEIKVKK